MNAGIKAKWIAALRSGDYAQTRGVLRGARGFCCLGVLCDVVAPDGWDMCNGYYDHHTRETMPSDSISQLAGISHQDANTLASMNDEYGASFQQIAEWIEERL